MENYTELGVVAVFAGTILGIFLTKTKGFGKYTTASLILTLVLFVASMALFSGKIESAPIANLLFAIAGYAGGFITDKIVNKANEQGTPKGS